MTSTKIGFLPFFSVGPVRNHDRKHLCTVSNSRKFKRRRTRESRIQMNCPQYPEQAILTLDIGTSTIKCAPYFATNHMLGPTKIRTIDTQYTGKSGTCVTQNTNEWYNGVIAVMQEVILSHPEIKVLGISVTGQMQDLIAVGKKKPSSLEKDVILYSDRRAGLEAERLSQILKVPVQSTSLLAKLSFVQTAYIKENGVESENPFNFRLLFGAADFITYSLSAHPKATVTDATTLSTTGLSLGPKHRDYDHDALIRCGLSGFIKSFPRILDKPEIVGKLSSQAAAKIGCPELQGIDIIHAGGDVFTATVGAGCISGGTRSYVYAGTSGWIGATVPWESLLHNRNDGVFFLGHAIDDSLIIAVASVVSIGESLRTCSRLLLNCSVDELNTMAEGCKVGADGLVFIPYINGKRCPTPTDHTTGGLYGMRGNTKREHIARALIEGAVFSMAEAGRQFVSPYEIDSPSILTGGVSKCQVFCEGIAALCGEGCVSMGDTEVGLLGAGTVASIAKNLANEISTKSPREGNMKCDHKKISVEKKQCHEWHIAFSQWRKVVQSFETLWGIM